MAFCGRDQQLTRPELNRHGRQVAGDAAYPFYPESRNTAIGVLDIDANGRLHPGMVPCWIDDEARPL